MSDMSTEVGLGTGVPTAAGLPAAPPPVSQPPARQAEGDRAVASNVDPTTDHEDYAVKARDEAVEKLAEAYDDADEPEAADKIRALYEDKPADATA